MSHRSTKEYKEWREQVLERDGYACTNCGATNEEIHVDHIKPYVYFPSLRTTLENGRTLCAPCHRNLETVVSFRDSEDVEPRDGERLITFKVGESEYRRLRMFSAKHGRTVSLTLRNFIASLEL